MKLKLALVGLLVLGFVAVGCIVGPEKKAPRTMGGTGYVYMEDAEKADGTVGPGKADPRAQLELNYYRGEHEQHVEEYRGQSEKIDDVMTREEYAEPFRKKLEVFEPPPSEEAPEEKVEPPTEEKVEPPPEEEPEEKVEPPKEEEPEEKDEPPPETETP